MTLTQLGCWVYGTAYAELPVRYGMNGNGLFRQRTLIT